ncbi:hypothetical protein ZWY2020_057053 [Hordeum vulgare]|nr:hypothetical protein ZWY2020_057053 [Hordeum vulgare]
MHLDNPFCPLCNQNVEETDLHLLSDCVFAQNCWKSLIPNKKRGTSLYEETLFAIDQLPKAFAPENVILGCWTIWNDTNDKIFTGIQHTIQSWRFHFKQDLKLLQHKIKKKHSREFNKWVHNNFQFFVFNVYKNMHWLTFLFYFLGSI